MTSLYYPDFGTLSVNAWEGVGAVLLIVGRRWRHLLGFVLGKQQSNSVKADRFYLLTDCCSDNEEPG